MALSPETPVSPVAAAPPDRPTMTLEQALQNVLAIVLGDRRIDDNERQLLHDFMDVLAEQAANGGIGNGAAAAAPGQGPPASPYEMNQNTEDMGTVEGAEPQAEYAGGY